MTGTTAGRRYVALLRAINLGARNRVPMARLREVCEQAGCTDVKTYIASGNVVLSSTASAAELRRKLEAAIEAEFGITIVVVVLTAHELSQVVERNPFKSADPATIHVAFASGDLDAEAKKRFGARQANPDSEVDAAAVVGRQIYLRLPHGFGGASLPGIAISKVQPPVTIRTWRTVTKLHELVAAD